MLLLNGRGSIDMIGWSGVIVPKHIGRLVVGRVCLVLAVLGHLVLHVCRPPAPSRWEGAEELHGLAL
ncbi:hypothetical protein BKH03_04450 [Actinomyces naeslundii]|nr:hypothetical protein BKH03_04450 [Actinomyces naeslundii]